MQYKRLIKFRVITYAVLSIPLLGCAISPLAIHDNSIYTGLFNVEKARDENCNYSSIEGVGVKLGLVSFGVGYFNNKKLMVDKKKGINKINKASHNLKNKLHVNPSQKK